MVSSVEKTKPNKANLIVQRSAFSVLKITSSASFYEYAKNRKADNKDNDGKNDIYENCTKTNKYSCENESSSGGGIQKIFRGNTPAAFVFFK